MPRRLTKEFIPWREREFVSVAETSQVLICSVSKIYELAADGRLAMVRLPSSNKVGIRTTSVIALLEQALPWTPSDRAAKAAAARLKRQKG